MPQLRSALEALLFLADEPVTASRFSAVLEEDAERVALALESLRSEMERENRGLVLKETAGGFRMYTHPAFYQEVQRFAAQGSKKLTRASLEVLAIVAYRQPISRAEISALRGVNSDGVVATLLDRGLLRKTDKASSPGAPQLLGTTRLFLEKAGLNTLGDLPELGEFEHQEQSAPNAEEALPNPGSIA